MTYRWGTQRNCRAVHALPNTFSPHCSVNVPPMYYVDFFKNFKHLISLNLYASLVVN